MADCDKHPSLSHKNKWFNILNDYLNAHLIVSCLLSLCHCLKKCCTRVSEMNFSVQ